MRISDLEVGQFYAIKPTTRKKIVTRNSEIWGLVLHFMDSDRQENKVYKDSYYQYMGKSTRKIVKRLDSKRQEVYTYKPHKMLCLQTGEICKVAGYFIRTYFIKPTK
tara:strand:- start:5543 stop:5863 length:321 start_codon:yes stop_codon:yes gene_type:complete